MLGPDGRVMVQVTVEPGNCWRTDVRHRPDGRAIVGRADYVYRLVWERLVGPLTPDEVLDHLCEQKWCVNPTHLEPVTRGENVTRSAYALVAAKQQRIYRSVRSLAA
jgi:hypothetical protein